MNIIWFKRDLRAQDHKPLHTAIARGPSVGLFIIEPEWLASPEFHPNHLNFAYESLLDLKKQLHTLGVPLILRYGECLTVLAELHRQHPITGLFSHQETGLLWTFKRDIKVKNWCAENSILWSQFKQFGVVRKLKDRDTWTQKRIEIIERPLIQTIGQCQVQSPWASEPLRLNLLDQTQLKTWVQKGGAARAQNTLQSFLDERGLEYFRSLSSPNTAFESCSRLSPFIAWGNISITQIHHAIQQKKAQLHHLPYAEQNLWKLTLKQFESRLWWHCHFIQKLESEPRIEFNNVNRHFDGLRENEFDQNKFEAWCKGETGFPLIDACMRALLKTGWINFRMRAMLMSFASYQLWLHWKKPAEHLARHFIDFEPGIHYSQAQMQSGVTGINTIRIYSPKKQLYDQDPQGLFVKTYVPELADVPLADLAEPYRVPPLLRLDTAHGSNQNYPPPIVDPEASYQQAKERIFLWKQNPELRKESQKVLKLHGSRASEHFPKKKPHEI